MSTVQVNSDGLGLEPSREDVQEQVERILASPMFIHAERASRLLRSIIEISLDHEHDSLKETLLGAHAFDRDPSYDPKIDPIVRVQAGRLRSRLTQYYETVGASDSVRIELPKGGYRPKFSLHSRVVSPPSLPPAAALPDVFLSGPHAEPEPRRRSRVPLSATMALVLLAALILLTLALRTKVNRHASVMPSRGVVTASGENFQPSVSPDGRLIAYVRSTPASTADVYVAAADGSHTMQLTHGTEHSLSPAWAPDSRDIAFLRIGQETTSVFVVPVSGAPERKIGELRTPLNFWSPHLPMLSYGPGPAWTADGDSLVVTDNPDTKGFGLFLWPLNLKERHRLTTPPAGAEDIAPACSPDGKQIAFARYFSGGSEDLFLLTIKTGAVTRLTTGESRIQGLTWTNDGRHIIYSSDRTGSFRLWSLSPEHRDIDLIPTVGMDSIEPSASRVDPALFYTNRISNTNIWRLPLPASHTGGTKSVPQNFLSSSRNSYAPQYSPDGARVVYLSDQTGEMNLWLADAEGHDAHPLTHLTTLPSGPRWSPDGKAVAFYANVGNHRQIFTVDVSTALITQVLSDAFDDASPNWSRDGRSLYFHSDRNSSEDCWRVDTSSRALTHIASRICWDAYESYDRQWVYFVSTGPGLWRVRISGGATAELIPGLDHVNVDRDLFATATGLYFVDSRDSKQYLQFYNTAGRTLTQIVALVDSKPLNHTGLSISPDHKYVLFATEDESRSEILKSVVPY